MTQNTNALNEKKKKKYGKRKHKFALNEKFKTHRHLMA